jgi:hypothetical protein
MVGPDGVEDEDPARPFPGSTQPAAGSGIENGFEGEDGVWYYDSEDPAANDDAFAEAFGDDDENFLPEDLLEEDSPTVERFINMHGNPSAGAGAGRHNHQPRPTADDIEWDDDSLMRLVSLGIDPEDPNAFERLAAHSK